MVRNEDIAGPKPPICRRPPPHTLTEQTSFNAKRRKRRSFARDHPSASYDFMYPTLRLGAASRRTLLLLRAG
jgi:hypothetical protein